jgi:lysyl endopeptidase
LEIKGVDIVSIPKFVLPKINIDDLLREDLNEQSLGKPFRFGKAIDVNINFFEVSKKIEMQDKTIYFYKITSVDAYSINLIFDQFYLSENASLMIYNIDGSMSYGPVNYINNPTNSNFWTDLVKGDGIIIQVTILGEDTRESKININKIIHGYRNTFSGYGQSAICNRDISCPEGDGWRDEANSVAMLLLENGQSFCSGVLLNNTCNDFSNNFLTAFHCLDTNRNGVLEEAERNQVNNWVFRFLYESPNCGGGDGFSYQSINGSTFRSAFQPTDFALLNLATNPLGSVTYAGWERVNVAATSATAIHHPNGDVKKISIDNNPLTNLPFLITWDWDNFGNPIVQTQSPPNSHWQAVFDNPAPGIDPSTVQHGSSGSPIFNQNGRVVGQLHGDFLNIDNNFCENRRGQYGRFDVSWGGGGTPATRLRDWLDPNNTGNMATNTIAIPSVTGPDRICTTNTNFTLQNVPAGQTVTWAVSPIHLFPTTGRSGTGATAALRAMHSSSSGLATLTYTIDTGCGEFQVQKQIWVGVPDTGMQVDANYYPICMNEYTYINAFYDPYNTNPAGNKASDITNFIWEQPSGVSCFTAGTKNEVLACWFTNPDNYIVRVRAVNSCGQGALRTVHFNVDSWGCSYFSVGISPNPANGRITIELTETPLDDAAKSVLQSENKGSREYQEYSFNSPPHRIRVFDIVGAERLCVENVPEGNSYQLDISHLTPGVYVVHLEHRNGTVIRQLRVD